MIRVAWQVPNTDAWIGGLNYFRNLLEALLALPDRRVDPVLLNCETSLPEPFNLCPVLPNLKPPGGWFRKIRRRMEEKEVRRYDNGGRFARYLRRNKIALLSHGPVIGRGSPVPAACWIPDFQHRYLPAFFTSEELRSRDEYFRDLMERSQAMLYSSEAALRDSDEFLPGHAHKAHVLHFVAPVSSSGVPDIGDVRAKYGVTGKFFHIPNQLWAHKNHRVVRDALRILRDRGECPLVVSTGQTDDYRNPGYFPEFRKSVEEAGLAANFLFLGLIPYGDMQAFMRESVALINPSLFEGWSTTVEEGKSLGKRILLSDISVHREQNPERGAYFDPHDPETLAQLIAETLASHDPVEEERAAAHASAVLPARLREFALRYEELVIAIVKEHGKK